MDESQANHLQSGARCPQNHDWDRRSPYKQGLALTWALHMDAASWGPQACLVDVTSPMWPFCLIPNLCSGVLRVENQRQPFSWALWGWSWVSVEELCPWEGRARQSCSTGYSVQKPFLRVLALFRAKEQEAGVCSPQAGLSSPGSPSLQPLCSELVDFSHPHPSLCSPQ